ncbi:MAG: hypothetical protein R3B13_03060 [Polyangiaceae bacterium]
MLAGGRALEGTRVAAAQAQGRYLVTEKLGRFELVDAANGNRRELDARIDARDAPSNRLTHRNFAFDAQGKRLAYLLRTAPTKYAVVELELGSSTVRMGPSLELEPLRLRYDAGGSGVWLDAVVADSNADGRRSLPVALSAAPPTCAVEDNFVAVAPQAGDDVTTLRIDFANKRAAQAPGLLRTLRGAELRRDPAERLLLVSPTESFTLADEECGGRILSGNEALGLVLIACYRKPGRAPLRLVGRTVDVDLEVDLAFAGDDHLDFDDDVLYPLHPGRSAAVVDFERRVLVPVADDGLVVSTAGRFLLLRDGKKLLGVLVPAQAGARLRREVLLSDVAHGTTVVEGAEHLSLGGVIVARRDGKVLGRVPEPVIGLDVFGRALVGGEDEAGTQLLGPLRYVIPNHSPGLGG